jgi:hypothetical protein
VTRSNFRIEEPQILGATIQNLVVWATWCPGFVHSSFNTLKHVLPPRGPPGCTCGPRPYFYIVYILYKSYGNFGSQVHHLLSFFPRAARNQHAITGVALCHIKFGDPRLRIKAKLNYVTGFSLHIEQTFLVAVTKTNHMSVRKQFLSVLRGINGTMGRPNVCHCL